MTWWPRWSKVLRTVSAGSTRYSSLLPNLASPPCAAIAASRSWTSWCQATENQALYWPVPSQASPHSCMAGQTCCSRSGQMSLLLLLLPFTSSLGASAPGWACSGNSFLLYIKTTIWDNVQSKCYNYVFFIFHKANTKYHYKKIIISHFWRYHSSGSTYFHPQSVHLHTCLASPNYSLGHNQELSPWDVKSKPSLG